MTKKNEKITVLDLFAGAGGLSEGFLKEGFDVIGHIEMDKCACQTLETRIIYFYLKKLNKIKEYERYLKGKVSKESLIKKYSLQKEIDKIINVEINDFNCDDLIQRVKNNLKGKSLTGIIGGPPCQAYSNIGRARDKDKMKGDDRNYLYRYYLKFLKELKPSFFVFENVPGLLSAGKGKYLKSMISGMKKLGYTVPQPEPINTADFGLPQRRKRVIMIGWRKNVNLDIDMIFKKTAPISNTVNAFLEDLPKIQAGAGNIISDYVKSSSFLKKINIRDIKFLTDHVARPHSKQDKEIYRIAVKGYNTKKEQLKYTDIPKRLRTHKNERSFLDRFKVIEGNNNTCHTIVAHISKDGHYYIHPDISQNRSLTVREAARLQTFPDSYKFEGTRTAQLRQIGNAVPPMFSQILAVRLKSYLIK